MDRGKQREIASKGGMASHRRRQEQQPQGGEETAAHAPDAERMVGNGNDEWS